MPGHLFYTVEFCGFVEEPQPQALVANLDTVVPQQPFREDPRSGGRLMVGGTVIETISLPDRIWINCGDTTYPSSTCAIEVVADARARSVSEGDIVWWQDKFAMWTPACLQGRADKGRSGVDFDIRLDKIGYSGVPRPTKPR